MNDLGVCRLCLVDLHEEAQSLLDPPYKMMLESLSAIQMDSNSSLSTVACLQCVENLEFYCAFRQNIINCDQIYREQIGHDEKDITLKEIFIEEEIPVESLTVVITNDNAFQLPKHVKEEEYKSEEIEVDICEQDECNDEVTANVDNQDAHTDYVDYVKVSKTTDKLECSICLQEVQPSEVETHITMHFKEMQMCLDCNTIVGDVKSYQLHIEKKHNQRVNAVFKCLQCPLNFPYKAFLKVHIKAHEELNRSTIGALSKSSDKSAVRKRNRVKRTPSDLRIVECSICFIKVRAYRISVHMETHKTGPKICELCGATLCSRSSLRNHMSHKHGTYRFCCDECGQVFKEQSFLTWHIKKKHINTKDRICEMCGKKFFEQHALNEHIRRVHMRMLRYKCDYCIKSFYTSYEMKLHRRGHTQEAPYKCDMCTMAFKQRLSLRLHKKSKHKIYEKRTVACTECDKMFISDHGLITHMRSHV